MRYYRIRRIHVDQGPPEPIVDGGYLCHYGIKGQKWGIRRFQNEDGTYTTAGKERYGTGGEKIRKAERKYGKAFDAGVKAGRYTNDPEIRELYIMEQMDKERRSNPASMTGQPQARVRLRDRSAVEAANAIDLMSKQDLTKVVDRNKSKQGDTKQAETQAALNVISTLMNPFNAVFLAKQGVDAASAKHKVNSYMKNREKNSTLDESTGLYMKHDGEYSDKQDLAAVNPGFKNFNSNTKNNCMLCTTTYDLRQRGYDVTAQLDSQGYNFGDLKRWYPKAKFEKSTRVNSDGSVMKRKDYINNTINMIQKQGDGARGNLMVWFAKGWDGSGGGGHSMVYEVRGDKVIIKDGQTGKVYKNPQKILAMTDASSFARLDNIDPDMKRIKAECVR